MLLSDPAVPGKKYLSLYFGNYHAPSPTGQQHCTSNGPFQVPAIDPRHFEDDADLQILVVTISLENWSGRRLSRISRDDEGLREYIKKIHYIYYSPWHTSSSCSILLRDKGGVVASYLVTNATRYTGHERRVASTLYTLHLYLDPAFAVRMILLLFTTPRGSEDACPDELMQYH